MIRVFLAICNVISAIFRLFYAKFIFPFSLREAVKQVKKETQDLPWKMMSEKQNGMPDNYFDPNNKEFMVANQLWEDIKICKAKISTSFDDEKKYYFQLRRQANENLIAETERLKAIGFRWIRPD